MSKMVLNIVEMTQAISKLDGMIEKLENTYKDINTKMKCIDGTSDTWEGDTQSEAYKCYLTIASDFPNSLDKMKALRLFLENALNSYINGDKTIYESIDKNIEGLDFE